MQAAKHPGVQFNYTVSGRYGSAWNEKFSGASLRGIQGLTRLGVRTSGLDGMRNIYRGLTPSGQWVAAAAVTAKIKSIEYVGPNRARRYYMPAGVIAGQAAYTYTTGPESAEFPTTNFNSIIEEQTINSARVVLNTEEDISLLLPDAAAATPIANLSDFCSKWSVILDVDVIPTRIRSADGKDRILNVDFWLSRGCTVWRQDPTLLFPSGRIPIVGCLKPSVNVYNYTWQTEELSRGGEWLAAYFGMASSTRYFERAIAQACNFHVATVDDSVITSAALHNGQLYELRHGGMLLLDYPHNIIANGTQFRAGDVLGDPIKILTASHTTPEWWRDAGVSSVSRSNTIPALPFDVTFPNAPVLVDAVNQTGGNIHARLNLPAATTEELQKYWYAVERSEKLSGYFLNAAVGLPTVNDKTYVWPLPILFNGGLGPRVTVIQRKQYAMWSTDRQTRFTRFVTRARPSNSIIITVDA